LRCTVNKTSKHKLHTLGKKKGKEISDIVKNYDYSSFHLSPTREKKKHASGSYLFLKGKSEKDRQIEKKREVHRYFLSATPPSKTASK